MCSIRHIDRACWVGRRSFLLLSHFMFRKPRIKVLIIVYKLWIPLLESFFKPYQVEPFIRYNFYICIDEEQNDGPTCHHCWLYENYANKTMSLCAHSAPASIINALVDACCMIGWGSHWMDISESASPTSLCVSADDNDGCTMFASSDQVFRAYIYRLRGNNSL